ncbi:HTH domain-containing protein [Methylocystis hirsuta]|uniref:HTH domain-containing protein n=1 Tax=Methylocystis hirsuta TaxID=369798 RepID=A0A3M9XLP5_9HYPH|nr:HTH domain-containing protein [Methylocystis hirsuta]RNJ48745.1 HTH domain-containing protein [Methylocystis hirsuta]
MSRTHRLFELLQMLRRRRRPVSGAELAREAGVSLRTLYRDIAALQAMGAEIDGEPGVGYVLRPGFLLPPLMFSEEEIEALALGAKWVVRRTDDALSQAAGNALAKISAVLPRELRTRLEDDALLVGPGWERPQHVELTLLRRALRQERKFAISYRDEKGARTQRVIWPIALGFFESARVLVGWCELRRAFRHFRTDRIEAAHILDARPPRRRQALVREWRQTMLTEADSSIAYSRSASRKPKGKSMAKELVFYTNPQSRGMIAHWMLEEVGAPYSIEVKDYGTTMKAPEYLAINPMGKVPAIRHGETVVTEAAAICAYLADAFPEAGLAPEPEARGDYYRWLFFAAGCVEPAMSNHAAGWDPATPEMQARFGYGSYAAVIDALAKAVAGRRYVAGDRFTAADVYVGSMIGFGLRFGVIDKRPEFEAYWSGMENRPARLRAGAEAEKLASKQAWAAA